MTVRFLGYQEVKKNGCPVCGGVVRTQNTFQKNKMFVLPSGGQKRFFYHKPEKVNDIDGKYLLEVTYQAGDRELHAFEEVI